MEKKREKEEPENLRKSRPQTCFTNTALQNPLAVHLNQAASPAFILTDSMISLALAKLVELPEICTKLYVIRALK